MQKFLTDVHTHSTYSFDGQSALADMLETARAKGLAFYGVSEHFDYAYLLGGWAEVMTDAERYFHGARHLQEDYEGCMNVLIGAEFGYTDDARAYAYYKDIQEKYRPDFIVNSVHSLRENDYYDGDPFREKNEKGEVVFREKREVYKEYLGLIRKSLDAPYDYDIVGHIGYLTRYAPYEDKSMPYQAFAAEIDEILKTVVKKGKILELNASGGVDGFLPTADILKRYYALGGRKISYASDAHAVEKVAYCRDEAVKSLKEIGFTHITVPCKGEYIKVEL